MLSDREIINILRLKLNQPINPLNFRALGFSGSADGSFLTRLYNKSDLINNFIRIISLKFAFYSPATWMRESAEDNKTFTAGSNSRYSMIRANTRLDYFFLENHISTNQLQLFVDNNSMNIFPQTFQPVFEKIDLNIMYQSTINDGIDIKLKTSFFSDMESNIVAVPDVTILMFIEILNNVNPLKLEQTIE